MRRSQNLKKISHLFSQNSCCYLVASKQVGDFFKFLWPSHKSWTLSQILRFGESSTDISFIEFMKCFILAISFCWSWTVLSVPFIHKMLSFIKWSLSWFPIASNGLTQHILVTKSNTWWCFLTSSSKSRSRKVTCPELAFLGGFSWILTVFARARMSAVQVNL